MWLDGSQVLDKVLKTKGAESAYFCQPGIHRSPHRESVDVIYFDNFILADTLAEVLPVVLDGKTSTPAAIPSVPPNLMR